MAEWQTADLRSIPAVGPGADPAGWEGFAPDPAAYAAGWHGIREHFGLTGFGVNAVTADSGGLLVVPHDEMEFGRQEELYVVVEGRARFTCDGEDVELGPGGLMACRAKVARQAVALESPTTVLMVSGGDVPPNL
jgi:uncharacterized cupin superfamily protein